MWKQVDSGREWITPGNSNALSFEFNWWAEDPSPDNTRNILLSEYFTKCNPDTSDCPTLDIANLVIKNDYNSNDEIVYIRPKFIESEIFTYDSLINLLEPVTEEGRSDPILQPPSSGILKSQDLFNSLSASYKVQNGRLIKL